MGYYRTRAEIHMRNLRFNVQSMKKRLGDGTPMAMARFLLRMCFWKKESPRLGSPQWKKE